MEPRSLRSRIGRQCHLQQRRGPPLAAAALTAVLWWCCCCSSWLAAAAAAAAGAAPAGQQCTTPTGGGGAIIDLTVPVRAGLPVWEQKGGLSRHWRALSQSKEEGDVVNQSHLNLDAHTGTHIVRICMQPRFGLEPLPTSCCRHLSSARLKFPSPPPQPAPYTYIHQPRTPPTTS
jgi:hypothetical protein